MIERTKKSIRIAGICLTACAGLLTGPVSAQAPDPGDSTKILQLNTFATFSSINNSGAIDLQHSYDGTGRVFVSTNEGKIHAFSSTGDSLGTFLDLDAPGVLPDFEESVGGFTIRGLSYMAFHPDYGNPGAAGEGSSIPSTRLPSRRLRTTPTRAPGSSQHPVAESVNSRLPSGLLMAAIPIKSTLPRVER